MFVIGMVVIAVIVAACKKEYLYYQWHFKIEKVRMSRISIEGFPADKSALYLLEVAYSNAPLDSVVDDGKLRALEIYAHGSIDTITDVTFMNKELSIHPDKLHWKPTKKTNEIDTRFSGGSMFGKRNDSLASFLYNNVDTFNAFVYLREINSNRIVSAVYVKDYGKIPKYMKGMDPDAGKCLFDSTSYCSSRFLVSFDCNSSLPDDGYVEMVNNKQKRKIKIDIINDVQNFKLAYKISHYKSRK